MPQLPTRPRASGRHSHRPSLINQDEAALTRRALPILRAYAKHMHKRLAHRIELEELVSVGLPVITDAVRCFDPARSTFRGYLLRRLRWAMLAEVRKRARRRLEAQLDASPVVSRRYNFEIARRLHTPIGGSSERRTASLLELQCAPEHVGTIVANSSVTDNALSRDEDPEQKAMRGQRARAVHSALGALPERQRRLLERHYFGGERFDLLTAEIGVSKCAACRLHKRAVRNLASELSRNGLTRTTL